MIRRIGPASQSLVAAVSAVFFASLCSARLPAQTIEDLRKSYPPSLAITQDLTDEDRAQVAATLVTIHLSDRPRVDVIREAARQAHLEVFGPRPENLASTQLSPITVDLERQPLWWALSQAVEGTDEVLSVRVLDERRLQASIGGGMKMSRWWTVSGPARFEMLQPRGERRLPNGSRRFEAQLTASTEPKMTVIRPLPLRLEKLVDENGAPFDVVGPRAFEYSGAAGPGTAFYLPFIQNGGMKSRSVRIRGSAPMLAELKSDRHLLKATVGQSGAEASIGGLRWHVRDVSLPPKRNGLFGKPLHIELAAGPAAGDKDPKKQKQETESLVRLVQASRTIPRDQRGRSLVVDFKRVEAGTDNAVQIRLDARCLIAGSESDEEAQPASVEVRVPTKAGVIELPFEFPAVRLPD